LAILLAIDTQDSRFYYCPRSSLTNVVEATDEDGEEEADEWAATTGISEPDPLRPVLYAMLPHLGGLAARRELGRLCRAAAG
jgi:hypothetical protein